MKNLFSTINGYRLNWVDFGGEGDLAHISHATSFPAQTYRNLANYLTNSAKVIGLNARGCSFSETPSQIYHWNPLAEDLEAFLLSQNSCGVRGIGHSLGGILSLMAAHKRTELFRDLVLIEPIIFSRPILKLIKFYQLIKFPSARSPSVAARKRKEAFPTLEEMRESFRSKAVFAEWDSEVLEDYLEYGSYASSSGMRKLLLPKEIEAQKYDAIYADTWNILPKIRCPVLLIRASRSNALSKKLADKIQKALPICQLKEIEGTHLLPMEKPQNVAQEILKFWERA